MELLLYDMQKRSISLSLPVHNARESLIEFLSLSLFHDVFPNRSFFLLEEFIRSEIVDSYPVRMVLVQEILRNVSRFKLEDGWSLLLCLFLC